MWDAVSAGLQAAFAVAAIPASYRRGDVAIELGALTGGVKRELAWGPQLLTVQHSDTDFIVSSAALEDLVPPHVGDLLDIDVGGRAQRFELTDQDGGQANWRYLPGNEFIRLTLTRVTDDVGASAAGTAPAIPSGKPLTFIRRVVDIVANQPLTIVTPGYSRITTVEVWKRLPNGTLHRLGPGISLSVTEDIPPVITITSGINLTDCRVFIFGS